MNSIISNYQLPKNFRIKELLRFYSFILLNIIVVYYMPYIINQIFYLITLIFCWRSKKNYFWLAYVFFLMISPAGLLIIRDYVGTHHPASYNLYAGISISYFDMIIILLLVKSLNKSKNIINVYRKELLLLLAFLSCVFIFSITYGIEKKMIINYIRLFLPFTFFYSFIRLLKSREEFYLFIFLIFPTAFLVFFEQLFYTITSENFISVFLGSAVDEEIGIGIFSGDSDIVRPTNFYAENILFNFLFALFFLELKNKIFSKKYLILIIVISFISVIMASSRLWITVFLFYIISYILFSSKNKLKSAVSIISIFLLASILIISSPEINRFFSVSFNRYSTIIDIAKRDFEIESSADYRMSVRMPRTISLFLSSPIFGLGFTEKFTSTEQQSSHLGDYHTGNFNLLANIGILGFLFFSFFWFSYFRKIYIVRKKLSSLNPYKVTLKILVIGFIGFLIAHFISYQFFGFTQTPLQNYFMVIYILFTSNALVSAKHEENTIKHNSLKVQ